MEMELEGCLCVNSWGMWDGRGFGAFADFVVVDIEWWLRIKVLQRDQWWHCRLKSCLHAHFHYRGPEPSPHFGVERGHALEGLGISMVSELHCGTHEGTNRGPNEVGADANSFSR